MATTTDPAPQFYLDRLRADSARLAEVARLGLDAAVPACPEWSVADLVVHTAAVYLHKVEAIRTNARPDPWPPDLTGREPLELYDEATATLLAELAEVGPDAPAWTFWPAQQTSGFWFRRMALETVVHRVDAEQAHGQVTPVDRALALDGIDEVLAVMLCGPWWADQDTAHPVDARVRVTAAGRSWTVSVDAHDPSLVDGADGEVAAEIFGDPDALLLWLWGRRGDDAIQVAGSAETAAEFRRRLVEATG